MFLLKIKVTCFDIILTNQFVTKKRSIQHTECCKNFQKNFKIISYATILKE